MKAINREFLDASPAARSKANVHEKMESVRWTRLCDIYLPVCSEESFWRFNRKAKPREPSQGWKLHISATVIEACDLFEKIAPFLVSQDVQFKAPGSLRELSRINSGLHYGYWQVGKCITVYPPTETTAVALARQLNELTHEFISIAVPFDERFSPKSSVFYRYGAFEPIEIKDENGRALPAVKNSSEELVYDDRSTAVPEWLQNPFPKNSDVSSAEPKTPLMTKYKVLSAITQRGKGGTYYALDMTAEPLRICILKEGRRYGELYWNGQDGYHLVKNEFEVLKAINKICTQVPQVFTSFEADGNFYFAMEYIEGKSLYDLMKIRQRRFSIKQTAKFALQIAKILTEIHQTGWIWNDCKPANLIVTSNTLLRPIDFENSYPEHRSARFDWKTDKFSKSTKIRGNGESDDFYALGAVVYFLLTGRFYKPEQPVPIRKIRRNVPKKFQDAVEGLLCDSDLHKSRPEILAEFRAILDSL